MRRFWDKVSAPNEHGCRYWFGGVDGKGYGRFGVAGRNLRAHRVAWELTHGPIPEGLQVCHKCDILHPPGSKENRRCVEPSHLFLGTTQENTADMVGKDRHSKGERHGPAKLTEAAVRKMRQLREAGETYTAIGDRYGVTKATARSACVGDTWGCTGTADTNAKQGHARGERARSAKLTEEGVRKMRQLRATGESYASLAGRFGVSKRTALLACKGLSWKCVE